METEILQLLVGLVGGAGGAAGTLKWVMNGSKQRLEKIEKTTDQTNGVVQGIDRRLLTLEVRHENLVEDVREIKEDHRVNHG